jgi:hypothetical protein
VLRSILGAAPGDAGHDLVASGYLVLDDVAKIGEGGVLLGDPLLVALAARLLAGKQAMIDELGGEQLVYRVRVSLGHRLPEAADQGFVLFGRHRPERSGTSAGELFTEVPLETV